MLPKLNFKIKISLFFFLLVFSLLLRPFPSFAQEGEPLTGEDINLNTWTGASMNDIMDNLTGFIMGEKPSGHPLPLYNQEGTVIKAKQILGGGAVGGLTSLIGGFYNNPPASSREYLAYLGKNLGFVSPTYAQEGKGFEALEPILGLWKAMRNVAYLLLVIFFIIAGLMIMFRVKISPQVAVTLQNALPRIVMAIVLITFSYAIAGFLIDLMYVVIYLLIAIFNVDESIRAAIFSRSIFTLTQDVLELNFWKFFDALKGFLGGGKIAATVSFIATPLAGLIISIAIVFALFKLFFVLLMAYITLIALIIFSPILLLLSALPGQKGAEIWLRQLLANLSVFPVAAGMFILGGALMGKWGGGGEMTWRPPLLGLPGQGIDMSFLIALGIILLLPKVLEMTRDAFKAPAFKYGVAIGEALKAGVEIPWVGGREAYRYEKRKIEKAEEEKKWEERIRGISSSRG